MRVGIIGGGIVGLTIGWECQRRGHTVTVADPQPGRGASHVAAGMLAPVGEAYFGERELTALLVKAAAQWPGFVRDLGADVGYRAEGTLQVGLTADDLGELGRLWSYQERLGFEVRRIAPRDLEPGLSPRARGVYVPADHQVDPRRVVRALLARVPVRAALGEVDVTVIAAGIASAAWGLPVRPVKGVLLRLRGGPPLRHVIRGYAEGRPVYLVPRAATPDSRLDRGLSVERDRAAERGLTAKGDRAAERGLTAKGDRAAESCGEVLGLTAKGDRAAEGGGEVLGLIAKGDRAAERSGEVLGLTAKSWGAGEGSGGDGEAEVLVGATSREGGDRVAEVGAVRDLLRAATDLVPDLAEAGLVEVCVGHRPATPDNGPIVGALAKDLLVATGHYRHGVLAAPLTAQAIADLVEGKPIPPEWQSFGPGRFA